MVKGPNPGVIWLFIVLVLVLVTVVAVVVYVVAPAQQFERQVQATRLAEQAAVTQEAQRAAMTVAAQQAAAALAEQRDHATVAAQSTAIEQHYAAGLAFAQAGDWPAAAVAFRQTIALDAGYKDAQTQLQKAIAQVEATQATATAAAVALAAQSQADAQATAASGITATAQALAALYARGQGLMNLGRWPEAEGALQGVFDVDPAYQDVQTLLATVAAETAKLAPTATPLPTHTPTVTPTPLPSATSTPNGTATAVAAATGRAAATQTAQAGPTAPPTRQPTSTPPPATPDWTATAAFATAEALRTRPTWTPTPTNTPTLTPNPTATAAFVLAQAVATAEALGLDPAGLRVNPVDGALYLRVPAGEFMMGSDSGDTDERPVHAVYLDEFWIMRTEVTNAQYARCVKAGACTPPDNTRWQESEYAEHPVTHVDWGQANAYAAWVGGRLPTEAEWEKACRSSDGRTYPWGNAAPDNGLLNFSSQVGGTQPVGSYPAGASPYGPVDMAGNVWEWTADWYDSGYYTNAPARNPAGPTTGTYRTLRGGSWPNSGVYVRCAVRGRLSPRNWDVFVGFRVVSPGF